MGFHVSLGECEVLLLQTNVSIVLIPGGNACRANVS